MMSHDPHNVMEQSALRWVIKTLSLPNRAEWLAWKACQKDVELWDVSFVNLCDVTVWDFTKVCFVGLLGVLVPLGRKDALPIGLLKCEPHPTDTGEKVNELEVFGSFLWHGLFKNPSALFCPHTT